MVWDESLNKLTTYDLERLAFELEDEKYAYSRTYGEYKCARCSNPLYHSKQKYIPLDSAAAQWPTFRAPVSEESSIQTRRNYSFGLKRTEVLCKNCGLHIGYVYPDGKECGDTYADSTGERHCVLPLALEFEEQENPNPEEDLEPVIPNRAAVDSDIPELEDAPKKAVQEDLYDLRGSLQNVGASNILRDRKALNRASKLGIQSPIKSPSSKEKPSTPSDIGKASQQSPVSKSSAKEEKAIVKSGPGLGTYSIALMLMAAACGAAFYFWKQNHARSSS